MQRCPKCPNKNNCIPADGPTDSLCLFVGEAPGPSEKTKPFTGKTGRELNENYLPLAGFQRPNVRIMNAISCMPPGPKGKLDPKNKQHMELLESCSNHFLIPEIKSNRYKLLVPLGSFACRAIDPTIDLELEHGIPRQTPYGMAFPMYHPAGGLHEPKKMLQIRTDWIRLRKYIAGRLRIHEDEYPNPGYRTILSPEDLDEGFVGCHQQPLACDTEIRRNGDPHCLTFSCAPGTGFLIEAERIDILDRFQEHLDGWEGPILFHNWLFDEGVVVKMGLKFPRRKIKDTMIKSFHLGNVPQGLKAIGYRELGMKMQDFEDLVKPHSKTLCLSYIRQMSWSGWPMPQPETYRDSDGIWKVKQPQSLNTKVKRFLTDLEGNPKAKKPKAGNPDKDPFTAWENWEDSHEMVETILGPWPGMCISHAPKEEVEQYACRDADATIRWWYRLQEMNKRVRKTSQEHWGDS